jgi:hypothetical protein
VLKDVAMDVPTFFILAVNHVNLSFIQEYEMLPRVICTK